MHKVHISLDILNFRYMLTSAYECIGVIVLQKMMYAQRRMILNICGYTITVYCASFSVHIYDAVSFHALCAVR